ncbi:MAG: endonuclease/exonuclease/phosphatase family protein [Candidatus Binataceae bacterium]
MSRHDNIRECTVVTYNIFHDLPSFRHLDRRLELIAAEIAARRPHIVALQELTRAPQCGDIGAKLSRLVNHACGGAGYALSYAPADSAGEADYAFDEGVALMSRVAPAAAPEILKYRAQVELATTVGGVRYRLPDDRVALKTRFALEGGTVEAYVTHLTDRLEAAGGGASIRVAQARELVEWVEGGGDPATVAIIAGDLNDVPESDTVGAFIRAGFVDAYAAAGARAPGHNPGYTNDRDDIDLESQVASHNQRIDFILARSPRGRPLAIAEANLFMPRAHCEPGGRWLWASDHIGVCATFRL